jgi:integrase
MKVSTYIYPEKRNGIVANVPLQMRIVMNGKKTVFYTGYRCDLSKWDTEKQLMVKSTTNKAGQSAASINARLKALRGTVDTWVLNNPNGTIDELLVELRKVAGKKEKALPIVERNFYSDFDDFLNERKLSPNRHDHYLVLKRAISRFDKRAKTVHGYNLDLSKFEKFLTDEHKLSDKQKQRGINTVFGLMAKLRSFFKWALLNKKTDVNPFETYKLKSEQYGTPFYLSIKERNHIYNFDFSNRPALAIQRDIFIFQCLTGCRVGDLQRFTPANVIDGVLEYVAGKTTNDNPLTIRVPLTATALEIIARYAGENKLLPFISLVHYNEAIREIIKLSGIDRKVTVLNTITRKDEQKPIYEVASSHIARRTLIGNLYSKVKDPNIVGSLSGHVEGSKAFARYRAIDDEIKTDVLNLIE